MDVYLPGWHVIAFLFFKVRIISLLLAALTTFIWLALSQRRMGHFAEKRTWLELINNYIWSGAVLWWCTIGPSPSFCFKSYSSCKSTSNLKEVQTPSALTSFNPEARPLAMLVWWCNELKNPPFKILRIALFGHPAVKMLWTKTSFIDTLLREWYIGFRFFVQILFLLHVPLVF